MKNCIFLLLVTIVFTACTRNSSEPSVPIIKAIITLQGADSQMVKRYGYDANNKLNLYRIKTFTSRTNHTENFYVINRNSAGNIESFTTQSFSNGVVSSPIIRAIVNYTANGQIANIVKTEQRSVTTTVKDSFSFVYTNNNIASFTIQTSFNGGAYTPMQTFNFTYNSDGNCNDRNIFSFLSPTLRTQDTYQFDTNSNPTNFGIDLMLLSGEIVTKNNISSTSAFNITIGSGRPNTVLSSTSNFVYRYNSMGLPETATQQNILTSTSATTTNNIIYQY